MNQASMKGKLRHRILCVTFFAFLCTASAAFGQQPGANSSGPANGAADGDLQKATQNPVSSLISVPIQNNTNFGIGPFDRNQNVLNIQPVIPVQASENWNVIIRWIAPIVWQPAPGTANLELFGINEDTPAFLAAQEAQKNAGVFGFGDMNPTFFLSPAKAHKLTWGVGPVFVLPTATSRALGQGKFSLGPSVVALVQPGPWTIGILANNAWSVAGHSDRSSVNQMTFQYFINYNLKKGWYLSSAPILTANWRASSGNVWTVPAGGGIGRVFALGLQPVNISAQFYGNAAHPASGSPWGMRLSMAFLFPKVPNKGTAPAKNAASNP
ncbi:MAG TPA: neuromedin U [Candidatus Angelobacter sp.]|nr:neuromedin U [Candidatus Angelobacter sp.]